MSDLTREEIECLQRGNAPDSIVGVLCTMAIRALDAGWQPMSTAPRDGTRVLLTRHGVVDAGWSMRPGSWYTSLCWYAEEADIIAWMPLPPPCAEVPHE